MQTLAYMLVLFSACVHASWNVAMRSLKGNTAVLVIAHFLGSFIMLPSLIKEIGTAQEVLHSTSWSMLLICSIVVHSLYILFLAAAYIYGDVGLVYPLARGTAIVLATLATQFFKTSSIHSNLSWTELIGIITIVFGLIMLCCDAIFKSPPSPITTYQQLSTDDNSLEMVHTSNDIEESSFDNQNITNEDKQKNLDVFPSIKYSDSYHGKIGISIVLAICVGMCTATYTIVDAIGVKAIPTLAWSCILNMASGILLIPVLYFFYYDQTIDIFLHHKLITVFVAPAAVGAYLIVLYIFTLPHVNIALIIALREFSVLIGAILGALFLNESFSLLKGVAITVIFIGMIILKIS